MPLFQPIRRLIGAEQIREIPVWVGRDALLDELKQELLSHRRKVIVLVGQGGIGKTSLAAKLLEACGVDTRGGTVAQSCPFDRLVCVRVAEGMGFEEVVGDILYGVVSDLRGIEPVQLLRLVIEQMQKQRMLLVLDNLEDILQSTGEPQQGRAKTQEWQQLLNGLANNNHRSQIIITSREKPKDLADRRGRGRIVGTQVKICSIEGLSNDAGAEAFQAYGVRDELPALRQVAARVEGHTLAIELLAGYAVEYLEGYLCGYLQKYPELLTADLEPILVQQWQRQGAAGRDLLMRMCVLRVPIDLEGLTFLRLYRSPQTLLENGETPNPKESAFTSAQVRETEKLMNRLVDCQLVRRRYDKTRVTHFYDLHRAIADFAKNQCGETLPKLMRSVYSFYQTGAEIENPQTLDDLRPMLEAQHFAFQLGSYNEAKNLIYKLEKYLEPWGYWVLLQELCEPIVDRLDEASQPYILQRIGLRHRDWGNWNEAERYYRQGLTLAQKHDNRSMVAGLIGQLGDIQRNRGNWDDAERLYRQYQQMCEELGDRAGMATSWGLLGDIQRNRGNWDEAERLFRQCLEVEEELGDRAGMASSWGVLGDIENVRGNWDEAERLFRQSLQLREELGDRAGMAYSIGSLGEVELERGNLDVAERYLQDAEHRFQTLDNISGIAEVNYRLMQLEDQRNNPQLAQHHYQTAHQLFTQLGAAKGIEKIEKEWGNLGV